MENPGSRPSKMLNVFLVYPMRATIPNYLILDDETSLIICAKQQVYTV
jgi:hypothetical protein